MFFFYLINSFYFQLLSHGAGEREKMLRIILVVWATILFSACAQQTSMTLVDRESVGAVVGISFEVSLRDPEAILTEGQKETFVSRARRAALRIFALAGQSKDTVADIEIVVQSHDNRPRWWGTSVPYDITLLA